MQLAEQFFVFCFFLSLPFLSLETLRYWNGGGGEGRSAGYAQSKPKFSKHMSTKKQNQIEN